MIANPCPWCEKELKAFQLGSRVKNSKPKPYELTRYIKVCPYCNNCVKIEQGSLLYLLLSIIPLLVFMGVYMLSELNFIDINIPKQPYYAITVVLFVVGLLISVLQIRFAKENDV